jgi:hypothetical protein
VAEKGVAGRFGRGYLPAKLSSFAAGGGSAFVLRDTPRILLLAGEALKINQILALKSWPKTCQALKRPKSNKTKEI